MQELPADIKELGQRLAGRPSVELGGLYGGEDLASGGVEDGANQGVASGEVGVNGLAGHSGYCGDLFHVALARSPSTVHMAPTMASTLRWASERRRRDGAASTRSSITMKIYPLESLTHCMRS